MNILAFETSCDETSVAVVGSSSIACVTASQIDIHALTGGVVPEVAAREHVQAIIPLVQAALAQAQLQPEQIDRIAVTSGPGLMTSLLVGVETARTLAVAWDKPLFGINHIEGHIAANFLTQPTIEYPAIALVVSGGHTELLFMPRVGEYHLIGKTRDDAAGECFDKTARLLGLSYPGGPAISKLAAQGDPTRYAEHIPSPMLNDKAFDFSFSGLKTAVRYFYRDQPTADIPDLCAAIEHAIIRVLVDKTKRAVQQYQAKTVLVGGGVAANPLLRQSLTSLPVPVLIPPLQYCTDNAAMIAAACLLHTTPSDVWQVQADPNWELTPR